MNSCNKYELNSIQSSLLSMMKDVHSLMQEYDIHYTLCGGSLIGAIRHNGFIPWDDDIDIMMDRANRTKLLAHASSLEGYSIERKDLWLYRIFISDDNCADTPTIDIVTLDHAPDSPILRKAKVILVAFMQGINKKSLHFRKGSGLHKICSLVTYVFGLFLPRKIKLAMFDWAVQLGNKKKTGGVSKYDDLFSTISLVYSADIMDHICLHPFEDTELCIIEGYDELLTKDYGDYMTPPPESERFSHAL